jgi:hypothetical protein
MHGSSDYPVCLKSNPALKPGRLKRRTPNKENEMDYVATHTLELMKALEDAHEKVSAICRSHFLNSTPAVWSFCNRVCKRISEQQNELDTNVFRYDTLTCYAYGKRQADPDWQGNRDVRGDD